MRFGIVGNTATALTNQKAFLNNFEDVINRREDIQEDITSYQDTVSYTSSKVDYSIGENIYMLPSDMNVNIRSGAVWYSNKILVSDGKFSPGKNNKVNDLVLEPIILKEDMPKVTIHRDSKVVEQPTHAHESQKPTITHKEEKIALVLFLAGGFATCYMFR